jgi:DNA-binding transcriptional LysR family regulator
VEAIADGEQALRSDQANLKGRLRLSIPPSFEPWWRVLSAFQDRYPDVELAVYSTERRLDLIEDGIDVALRVGRVADESMVARRILTYRHLLVASPKLLERNGDPSTWSDLNRYPLATWTASPLDRAIWRFGEERLEPKAILATNDYMHLRDCALRGEAVTELPPFLAAPLLEIGQLRAVLPASLLPEQTLHLLYPAQKYPSTIVRAYLEFCRQEASGFLGQTPGGQNARRP